MEDADTQELLGILFEKAEAIKRLNGFTLRRDQIALLVEKVIEMEPFMDACLQEDSDRSLLHLALRLKQLPYKIWNDQAREE